MEPEKSKCCCSLCWRLWCLKCILLGDYADQGADFKSHGASISLVATGLLLTLALTHLLPDAIEQSSDIHDIGLTIWGTIMVLIALELFFNSHHHADTCPVCRASKAAKSRDAAQKAAAPITKIARSLTLSGPVTAP